MTTSRLSFWFRWVLITMLASTVLLPSAQTLPALLAGALTGAIVGAAQWLLLRSRVSWAKQWIWATLGGFLLAAAIAEGYRRVFHADIETTKLSIPVYLGITYILLGAPIGICQWLILRKHFRYAAWWIAASVAGYVFGLAGIITVVPIMTYVGGKVLASLVIGLLIGAITGAVLVWLFEHPLQKLELG